MNREHVARPRESENASHAKLKIKDRSRLTLLLLLLVSSTRSPGHPPNSSWNSSARSNSSFIRLSRTELAEYLDRYRRDCKSRITAGRRDSNRHGATPVYGTFSAPSGFQARGARCARLERRRSYRLRHTYVRQRLGITSLEIYPR